MISFKKESDVEKYGYYCYLIKQLKRSMQEQELSEEMNDEAKAQLKKYRLKKQELIVK